MSPILLRYENVHKEKLGQIIAERKLLYAPVLLKST
jgi:hypothetical protein